MQTTHGIEIWSLVDGQRQAFIELEDNGPVRLAWSQDGKVVAGAASELLHIWKRGEDKAIYEKIHQLPIGTIDFDKDVCQVEVANDLSVIAVAWGNAFALWNVKERTVLAEQTGELVSDMQFSASQLIMAIAGKNGTRLYDCLSGEVLSTTKQIGGLLQFVDCDRILLGRNRLGKIVGWHIPTKSSLEEIPIADRNGVVQDFRLTDKNRLVTVVWSESDPGYVRTSVLGD